MASSDAVFPTNIYVPQLVEPTDCRRGEVRGGQQQEDFMKDLALTPGRGGWAHSKEGHAPSQKACKDLVTERAPLPWNLSSALALNFPGLLKYFP